MKTTETDLDRSKLFWAEEDSDDSISLQPVIIKDIDAEFLRKVWKPVWWYLYYVSKRKDLQNNQTEFKKRKSPYCTLYSHFNNFLHYHGTILADRERKKAIERYRDNKIITDTWAETIEVAGHRWSCLSELKISNNVKTYFFPSGSENMLFLMRNYNHCFVGSFVISENFKTDRKDNLTLDWSVHGGKEYNGHAVAFEYYGNDLYMINSYYGRRENHVKIPTQYVEKFFSMRRKNWKKYVRDYCALHIY